MKTLGIAAIVVIATVLFGALAFTLYKGKAGDELVLKTIVESGERIVPGMTVVVDSMAAGRVRDVANEYGTIVATLAIENPLTRELLRIGTIRKANSEYVLLSTQSIQPGAPKLKSGDIVRVGGSAIDFIPKLDAGTRQITGVVIAIFFVMVIAWKIFRSFLPIGLSLALALLVGWVGYPFAVPFVDQYAQPALVGIHSSIVTSDQGGAIGLLSQLLSSRPNSSVLAFLLVTLISLPFSSVLIYKVGSIARRGFNFALIGGCLLTTLSVPAPVIAADISYSRSALRQEQADARKSIQQAASLCEAAERLLSANLVREASEKVVEGLFVLDTVDVDFIGYDDRIAALKGSLVVYSRSDEQRKLQGGKKVLDERIKSVRDHASSLQKTATDLNAREANIIAVYLVLSDSYKRRLREGLAEWSVVLNECRQLAGFPLALIRSGVVNVDNVTRCKIGEDDSVILPNGVAVMPDGSLKRTETQVKLTALEQEAEKLRRELEEVRTRQTQTVSAVVSSEPAARNPVTKPRKAVEKPVVKKVEPSAPVPAMAVPQMADSRTNPPLAVAAVPVVIVTPPAQVEPEKNVEIPAKVEIPDRATTPVVAAASPIVMEVKVESAVAETNEAAAKTPLPVAKPRVASVVDTKPEAYAAATPSAKVTKTNGIDKQMIPIAIVAGLIVLAIIGIAIGINRNGQSHEVTIAAQPKGGPFAEHKLVSGRGEHIILGDGEPRIEPTGLNIPVPATISINARGKAEIQPGTATVLLDGKPITGKITMNPGCSIQIKHDDQDEPDAETYSLRFVDPVASVKLQDVEEGELVTITQEK